MTDLLMYARIGAAASLCATAAWIDFRTSRIPNWLTFTGLFIGLAAGLAVSGPKGLVMAASGALITALVPAVLFKMRAIGGGDVKLFAAIGALLGGSMGLEIQIAAFMLGAAQGVFIWLRRGQLKTGFKNLARLALSPIFKCSKKTYDFELLKTEMKFGPTVLLGLIVAYSLRFLG